MVGFALDLDGVVWLGDAPIPRAAEAVGRLRREGHDVIFCTNSSMQTVAEVEAKLQRQGIRAHGDVITSATAAAGLLARGERVLVCGGAGVVEAIESRGATPVRVGPADAVLVGLDLDFDYDGLRAAATAVQQGARLIATNDDATYPTPEGMIPGGGAIVAAIERATGVQATVAGKPHAPMVELVRTRLGTTGVMVGDRPDTDGRFATALGYAFGLVLSGVTTSAAGVEPIPDLVAADLDTLVAQVVGPG